MIYKQPRVPQFAQGTQIAAYIRTLTLFLKDFCMESWMHSTRHGKEIEQIKKDIQDIREKTGLS